MTRANRAGVASGPPGVDGEGLAYLGRSYWLRLVPVADEAVKLLGADLSCPRAWRAMAAST